MKIFRKKGLTLIDVMIAVAIIAIFVTILIEVSNRDYKIIAEGTLDRIEYVAGGFLNSKSTIIYFTDNGTCVILGEHRSVPYPKNTRIRVLQKYKNAYKIEEVK